MRLNSSKKFLESTTVQVLTITLCHGKVSDVAVNQKRVLGRFIINDPTVERYLMSCRFGEDLFPVSFPPRILTI